MFLMFGLMVVWFLIRLLAFSLLVLFFAHQPECCWGSRRWGHVDLVRPRAFLQGFCYVPGPFQTVQRAELWILALQSSGAVHLGVDNLGVVRHVGRLLDGHCGSVPFELVDDGDLHLLIERMLRLRGLDTVWITKVNGHADEGICSCWLGERD